MQNLVKSCEQAGLNVLDIVFGPVAAAQAVLTNDEIQRGAVVIDIGGGTTDIGLFRGGALVHASVIGIGGLHVTNDLAVCLKVGAAEAEKIKTTVGAVSFTGVPEPEAAELTLFGEAARKIGGQHAVPVIRLRCEELFEMVRQELTNASIQGPAPCSAVLTGGTALLNGISVLAASMLGMPARVGLPQGVSGMKNSMMTPAYAAGIGLLAYAHQAEDESELLHDMAESMFERMKNRFKKLAGYKDFLETMNKKKKGVSYV
jgi:cell division protein FtsA